MNFGEFSNEVIRHGFKPRDCGNGHWQIVGGKFLVNFYPFKQGGPSYYVNGMNAGSRHYITLTEAIQAANNPPHRLHIRTRPRRKSYRGIKARLLRENFSCYWCRDSLDRSTATIDHVIPLSKGGTNGGDNLVLACETCNHDRRNDLPEHTAWEEHE